MRDEEEKDEEEDERNRKKEEEEMGRERDTFGERRAKEEIWNWYAGSSTIQ